MGIEHITQPEVRKTWKRIMYMAEVASNKHVTKTTHFLTPGEWGHADAVLCHCRDVQWMLDGGYQGAERKRLILYPDYMDPGIMDKTTEMLTVKSKAKGTELSHRDYLGALLSIGIERDVIGDIIVSNEQAIIFVTPEIKDFVKYNLLSVGNCKVSAEDGHQIDLISRQVEMEIIRGTVASLRIDSIVSMALRISRQKAQSLFISQKIKLNWLQVQKCTSTINEGDVISINGFGRLVILEIGNMSRSLRWHIEIGKLK